MRQNRRSSPSPAGTATEPRGAPRSPTVREEQAPGEWPASRGGHADLGVARHLPLPRLAPQLDARLVEEPVAVQSAGRELAAVRVERELAVARDALPAFDVRPGLAVA